MKPRLLTLRERQSIQRTDARIVRRLSARVSSQVSVGWSWYNQSQGVVEWIFTNADPKNQHGVVLLRNGYSR